MVIIITEIYLVSKATQNNKVRYYFWLACSTVPSLSSLPSTIEPLSVSLPVIKFLSYSSGVE